jgi:hypothetical protein
MSAGIFQDSLYSAFPFLYILQTDSVYLHFAPVLSKIVFGLNPVVCQHTQA